MPIYQYIAKAADGSNISGSMEAVDKSAVISMLRENGHYPIRVSEAGILQKEINFHIGTGVKVRDLAIFCRQFATIINAGVSVLNCLDILRQQTENKALREVIGKVYDSVQKGESLSSAMSGHNVFPPILIHMVEAGELSGNLDVAMERMAEHFENESRIYQKIKGALTYPVMISIIAVGVIILLLTFVVPNFVSMFTASGVELPATTRLLLSVSGFIRSRWYILVAIALLIYAVYKLLKMTDYGAEFLDSLRIWLPVIGPLNIKVAASRFTRTMGTLLGAGLSMIPSLEITAKIVGNRVISKGILNAREYVMRGVNLSQPIKQMGIFPPMVVHMIKVGEDTGSIETMLNKTADFYDEEVNTAIAQATSIIEPLVIVLMAVVVGFIVLSIVQPMFSMYSGVNGM